MLSMRLCVYKQIQAYLQLVHILNRNRNRNNAIYYYFRLLLLPKYLTKFFP